MTRRKIYKLIFIVFLIALAVTLIMPTIGSKEMEIVFGPSATEEQKNAVKDRFSSDNFSVEEESETSLVVVSRSLNDAVKNEVRIFDGVDDVILRKTWVEEHLMGRKINLGLDLQGGMHLVLQANYGKILQKYIDDVKSIDSRLADSAKLNDDERKQLENDRSYITDVILDESGGDNKEYSLKENYKSEITQQALELLRNRVDKFGVAEPSIRPSGNEAIEIQLPGVKDINSVKNAIGSTGSLEYRLVDDAWSEKAGAFFKEKQEAGSFPPDWSDNIQFLNSLAREISMAISLPDDLQIVFVYERGKDTKNIFAQYPLALEKNVSVSGTDISQATVNRDEYGQIVVSFRTTADGAAKFANATRSENREKRLAIVLDDKVRNAPRINEQITTGSGQITGGFTYEEAMTLARIIKEGALPVDLQIIQEQVVGPSLGGDSISAGATAIVIGLLGIMLFMIIYYKAAGVIADFGLLLNMVFMLAILSLLGFTLTLPGMAGFVLTVGMAVDANVIIYERIKEEIAAGKSVRMSILAGFDKAFWTIFDANLTTLIAAFILFQFGTGPIKGFAVTLFIGVLTSMFTALFVTRFIYELISLNKKLKKLSI